LDEALLTTDDLKAKHAASKQQWQVVESPAAQLGGAPDEKRGGL